MSANAAPDTPVQDPARETAPTWADDPGQDLWRLSAPPAPAPSAPTAAAPAGTVPTPTPTVASAPAPAPAAADAAAAGPTVLRPTASRSTASRGTASRSTASGATASRSTAPRPATSKSSSAGRLGTTLALLRSFLREQRPSLALGIVALVLSVWALVALPIPLRYAIDAALGLDAAAGSAEPGPASPRALWLAAGALAGLVMLQAVLHALAAVTLERAAGRVAIGLRSRLLGRFLRHGHGGDHGSGEGTTRDAVGRDVDRLRELLARTAPRLLAGLLTLAAMLGLLVLLDPVAAVIVLVTAGLCLLGGTGAQRLQQRRATAATGAERDLAETLDGQLAALRTVRAYDLEQPSQHLLAEAGERAARARSGVRRARALGGLLTAHVTGLGLGAVLLIGSGRAGTGAITPGELVMITAQLLIAVAAARAIVLADPARRRALDAGERLASLLADAADPDGREARAGTGEPGEPREPGETGAPGEIGTAGGEITLSALHAAGPHGPVVEDVSVRIPAGQHVAVVGRDGAELGALLACLEGITTPRHGEVRLNGRAVQDLPRTVLRRNLAVVDQEPGLMPGTVRENLRAGRPGTSDDEILAAARRTGADAFLTLLPRGYDTPLAPARTGRGGPAGVGPAAPDRAAVLSAGQERLLALTRALLHDAPVVVLEDVEAGLAPAEREEVRRAVDALLVGRTALIGSHDPRALRRADRVLSFEAGALVEDGAPATLAADPDSHLAARLRELGDEGAQHAES